MFEFRGRRSKQVLRAIRLKLYKSIVYVFIMLIIAFIALLIWFGVTKNLGGILASLFFITLTIILILIFRLLIISRSSLNKLYKVEEENLTIVQIDCEYFRYNDNYAKHVKRVSQITYVEDWGEYYEFSFKHMRHSGFVCQKDWISVGTIGEFEKLFKDKLVDKTKKLKAK